MEITRLRVLALTNVFWRPWDTTRGTYNQVIYHGLSERFEMTVLVPVAWPEWIAHRHLKSETTAKFDDSLNVIHFPYLYIPKLSQSINAILMLLSVILACPRITLLSRWDRCLGCWLYPDSVTLGWLARWRSLPMISTAIGSDVNQLAQKPIQRRQILSNLNRSSGVISVSSALNKELTRLGLRAGLGHVVYNGVDTEVFCPGEKSTARQLLGVAHDKKILLFVGHLKLAKGLLELLEAHSTLIKAGTAHHLYIVGEGPDRERVTEKINQLNLNAFVTLVGNLEQAKLVDWFRAADLFVLPSHMEGVPNVIMESLATGLPVVATDVGGIPEVVTPFCGELVPARNAVALARAIDTNLTRQFDTKKIRQHISQYAWKSTVDQYQKIINEAALALN